MTAGAEGHVGAPVQGRAGRELVAILTLAMAVSTFPQFALGALGPFITADLGLSRAAFGTLTTALFAVGGGLSPLMGPLTDRVGGRRALVGLFAVAALATAATAAAPSYPLLLAAVGVAGVAMALGNPATNRLLAVYVPARRKGVVTGVKQSGVQVGAFLAGAVLPPLARAAGWRAALAATAVAALAGVAAGLRAPGDQGSATGAREEEPAALGPGVTRLAVYALLMGAGAAVVGAYLPLYATDARGLDPAVAGLPAALVGATGVVARIAWGRHGDRAVGTLSRLLTLLALGAAVAILLLWGPGLGGTSPLWLGAVAFGATGAAWNAVAMLAIVRDLDPRVAGRASGRVLLGFYGGFVLAPPAFGASVDVTGSYDLGWAVVAALFTAAAVVAGRWLGRADPGPGVGAAPDRYVRNRTHKRG